MVEDAQFDVGFSFCSSLIRGQAESENLKKWCLVK